MKEELERDVRTLINKSHYNWQKRSAKNFSMIFWTSVSQNEQFFAETVNKIYSLGLVTCDADF